jgi:hypothetical protein
MSVKATIQMSTAIILEGKVSTSELGVWEGFSSKHQALGSLGCQTLEFPF